MDLALSGKDRARRIRAARELAGHRTPEALEAAMREAGYGSGYAYATIRKWEDEGHEQTLTRNKLEPLAYVCKLRLDFFVEDFSPLTEQDEDERQTLDKRSRSGGQSEGTEPGSQSQEEG